MKNRSPQVSLITQTAGPEARSPGCKQYHDASQLYLDVLRDLPNLPGSSFPESQ